MKQIQIRKLLNLTGHTSPIYTLMEGTRPGTLLSAGGDGIVAEWKLDESKKPKMLANVHSQIFAIAYLSQYRYLIIGEMEGGIHVIDLQEKEEIRYITLHKGSIFDIQMDEKNDQLTVASGDGTCSFWSLPNFTLLKQVTLSKNNLRSLHFHPQTNHLAIGCSSNYIHIINPHNFKVTHRFNAHENSVFTAKYSPDGKYLISGSRDAFIKVWDVDKNYEICHAIPAHQFTVNDIAFCNNLPLFATASRDKEIRIWDLQTWELIKVINKEKQLAHVHSVNRLLWQAEALFSCSDDRSIMGWKVKLI